MGLENPSHLVFLLVIVLLLFGSKRVPELARSLGQGIREFRTSITGAGAAEGADHPDPSGQTQHKTQPPATP
jgi:sec-independent protein translocase protein TatA